ncbi:MAG: hypothetical protein V1736_07815 [Pseudomonadota bacterium]
MAEKKAAVRKISPASTKQEMLEAYGSLAKELQEREGSELEPEKKREGKRAQEAVQVADTLSAEGIAVGINDLKLETNRMLTQLSERLDEEVNNYRSIQKAIEIRDKELQELYEIEKSASTLAALIEAQNIKRQEFESEMAARKENLTREIETIRAEWTKEKKEQETLSKLMDAEEKKRREREKEEFKYTFERERQLALDKFADEKAALEKEILSKREQMEKELAEREKAVAQSEAELNELRKRAQTFPKELEETVKKTVKDATDRISFEAKTKEDLLKKEFEGQRNVLTTRIAALEKTVEEQNRQIAKYSQQLEGAYQKVQDIALRAVEGSSNAKTLAGLEQLLSEQVRKQSAEK